jgi:hypothetical protein
MEAGVSVTLLLAVNTLFDGISNDPCWPVTLADLTAAVDAGTRDAAVDILRTFLREVADATDLATTVRIPDAVIGEGAQTFLEILAPHSAQETAAC